MANGRRVIKRLAQAVKRMRKKGPLVREALWSARSEKFAFVLSFLRSHFRAPFIEAPFDPGKCLHTDHTG
jgi:hypothetical protein